MAIPELKDSKERLTDCIYFGDPLSASVGTGFVPTNRTIATTAPLGGGGDLSTNRTLTISEFAGSAPGSVPTSMGGVVTFLRADGSWATPPTFGAAAAGYAPASGGGATNFLRADGTWAAPAGTGIAGLTTNWYPVATGATAIGNGRIEQATDELHFYTGYTSGTKYERVGITFDALTNIFTFRPLILDVPATTVSYLKFAGQNATGGLLCGTNNIAIDDTFFDMPWIDITVSNGLNSNISIELGFSGRGMALRATGPTTALSLGGFIDVADGRMFWFYNTTSQAMTIVNEDVSTGAAYRITTLTGGNVSLPANGSAALFIYSLTDARWLLVATNPPTQYPRTLGYIPYQNASGDLADSTLFYDSANVRYGFATATPKATVDVNGTFGTRSYAQILSAGLNSDLPAPTTSFMRVSGPASAFSIGGVAVVASTDGTRLTIYNTTSQAMTIVNEDASSTAAYRITTPTGADVVFPARKSVVHLVYSSTTSRWILDEAIPNTAGGATTQVQHNLAGALSGDTGLVVAGTGTSKVLTLGTDVPLSRKAAGHLELGVPGPAATAKIITGQSSIGGTDSNKAGGKLSLGGGAGTGTGGGGDTALVTAYYGTLGNTQNTHVDRLVYGAKQVPLTDSTDTLVASVGIATETGAGGTLWYTIYATDGTDMQIRRGRVEWGAVNKSSTITAVLGTPEEVDCTPVGTLTVTVAAVDSGSDELNFTLNAITSLVATVTTFEASISMAHDGRGAVTLA